MKKKNKNKNKKKHKWHDILQLSRIFTFPSFKKRTTKQKILKFIKQERNNFDIPSFRSKYKKLFRSEPETCLIESFFYPAKERNNSLFLKRKDHGTK